MKKLAVALLVIALVITASYAIIAVVTFEKSPVELTEAGLPTEKTQYKAELIYNGLAYSDGSYEYSVQAYVNLDEVAKGATPAEQAARKASAKNAIAQIKDRWAQNGYEIVEPMVVHLMLPARMFLPLKALPKIPHSLFAMMQPLTKML